MTSTRPIREDPRINPNSLHNFHSSLRGPQNIPSTIEVLENNFRHGKHPNRSHANSSCISFKFYDQRRSNAPFGYEHFVSLPPSYNEDRSRLWPLIFFFHGSGESQRVPNESFASIRHGIPKVILCYDVYKATGQTSPSITIPKGSKLRDKRIDKSPELVPVDTCTLLAENFITVTPTLVMKHGYGWNAPILLTLLDEIQERYRVDSDRVHLTGFSMGGYGVWDLALEAPDRFASLVPICGGGDPLQVGRLRHIPIRIYHGEQDDIIPAQASKNMYESLQDVDAKDVQYVCYPGENHDSWTTTYNDVGLYQWMLTQRRSSSKQER